MRTALPEVRSVIHSYYHTVFHRAYFASVLLLLAFIIVVNYGFKFNFSANFITTFLVYLIPFAIAYLLQWFYFPRQRDGFSRQVFWILLVIAPAIFAVKLHCHIPVGFAKTIFSAPGLQPALASFNYVVKFLAVCVPVTLLWYFIDRGRCPLYGVKASKNIGMYAWLLAAMIPVVIAAAAMPDFLRAYPKVFTYAGLQSSDNFIQTILFELAYGLDFLTVEFFFRGFLIIAFARYFGMRAILPAACFYCCIHLGKPMAEAISSFFGGLLLGMISYRTSSIWGGLLVHLGIAWLMELASYLIQTF